MKPAIPPRESVPAGINDKNSHLPSLSSQLILSATWRIAETSCGSYRNPPILTLHPQEGEVIAVGNGKILENGTVVAMEVKVGDRILFGKYAGSEIKLDGERIQYWLGRGAQPSDTVRSFLRNQKIA